MTTTDVLQIIGTLAITALGLLFYRTSTYDGNWFCKYGREALALAAAFNLTAAMVRVAVLFSIVDQTQARTINGLVAVGFVAILVQIVHTHRAFHQDERDHA